MRCPIRRCRRRVPHFMKPCSSNRPRITLLASGGLDALEERNLRAHLEVCQGCQAYMQEISRVTENLALIETRSDIQTSEMFHQRLVGRLRKEQSTSFWGVLRLNWRVVLPLAVTTAALVLG